MRMFLERSLAMFVCCWRTSERTRNEISTFLLLLLTHHSSRENAWATSPTLNSSFRLGLRSWKTKTQLKKGRRRKVENIFTSSAEKWKRERFHVVVARRSNAKRLSCQVGLLVVFHVVEATTSTCSVSVRATVSVLCFMLIWLIHSI